MNCSLLPNFKDFACILRKDITDDSSADISHFNKAITHVTDDVVSLVCAAFPIRVQISDRLFPACCTNTRLTGWSSSQTFRARNLAQVTLVDWLDNRRDKGVFLKFEVSLLYVLIKFWATSFSNQKSRSSSTTLKGNLSSILEIAN